jgi:acyl carrier protein
MATKQDVMEFIQTELSLKQIDDGTTMGQVRGWDSLKHVELILSFSDKFDVQIPPSRIGELISVSTLIEFLREENILED